MKDEAIIDTVKKITFELGSTGRILVRESGTEPLIRVMVEAADKRVCEKLALEMADIDDISPSLHGVLENGRSFFVSPKESDVISEEWSSILASAIDTLAGL